MKLFFLLCLSTILFSRAAAQRSLRGIVSDDEGEAVVSAIICIHSLSDTIPFFCKTNDTGFFAIDLPRIGEYELQIKYYGFQTYIDTIKIPEPNTIGIHLITNKLQETEIVVSATRTARNIADVPIRVELIPAEDLEESITMGLGSAKNVLGELPGVLAQTTSSSSGAAVMRMRGLDGKYSQILVDGIPAFGGLNMNFSTLLLPPLNLKQLEIIKGSAAGLLGADAIGGIINFITRQPTSEIPSGTAVLNYTSQGGADAAAYYSQKFDELGVVIHTTYNLQDRRDIDHDGFADIPQSQKFFFNPKITYDFSSSTNLIIAPSYTHESRLGGEMNAPLDYSHGDANIFSTAINTERIDLFSTLSHQFDEHNSSVVNAALVHTRRDSYWQLTPFNGTENIFYVDGQWSGNFNPFQLLAGASFSSDHFAEDSTVESDFDRSFSFSDLSLFGQAEYAFSKILTALGSIRSDIHNQYGTIVMPRGSLMIRPDNELTFRLSAGTGWRAPTIFDETAEAYGYLGVPALHTTTGEHSISYTAEGKYRFVADEWVISTDLNLFSTSIKDRIGLVEQSVSPQMFAWENIGSLKSNGAEIILQAHYGELDLFFGYTYSNVVEDSGKGAGPVRKEFTPSHFINASATWLVPDNIRLASDMMYESPQLLPENPYANESPAVFTFGGSVEFWLTRSLSIFLNVEDAPDTRQTRTMPLYLGTPGAPGFNSDFVWGPIEGRTINGGIKYKL